MRTPIVMAALLAASAARADAIDPPPRDCARGSFGQSSHEGAWCAPSSCDDAPDCDRWGEGRGLVCLPVGLCIAEQSYVPAGRMAAAEGTAPRLRQVAQGACATQTDCAAGTRCVVAQRCAEQTLPELVAREAGCTCAAAGAAPGAAWPWLAPSLGGLGLRRGRRSK
jgi:hypothetical protein